MPKKFEGHGSGEVEVKTGKMLGAREFSFAWDQELGDIRLIVELFRSGMRPLAAARLSTNYGKIEHLCFQI